MNRADLGPPIPAEAPDLPAFVIYKHSIMDCLSPMGEAIVTFSGHTRESAMEVVLVIACHPTSGAILRATVVETATLHSMHIDKQWVPGICADIARTKTLEVFGPAPATP